jgi:septation ring formation regulator EzrA
LRDSLLGAIDSVSRKLTALTDGQKTTNEHLKNIKEQSTKSNEHLKKLKMVRLLQVNRLATLKTI